jgi:YidC/Oxa1 family membrane protein insertase
MALAAAARSRRLSDHLLRHLHPALPHLLNPHCSSDEPPAPSPIRPLPSLWSPCFPLHQSSGTAQARNLLPLGLHLTSAEPSRRRFSSLPSSPVTGARAVLADAADAAVVPAASASFPGEVAWAAEDSALSVAAVQHLIDAVHSYTGLNWSGFSSFRDLLLLMQFFLLPSYSILFQLCIGGSPLLSPRCCCETCCLCCLSTAENNFM